MLQGTKNNLSVFIMDSFWKKPKEMDRLILNLDKSSELRNFLDENNFIYLEGNFEKEKNVGTVLYEKDGQSHLISPITKTDICKYYIDGKKQKDVDKHLYLDVIKNENIFVISNSGHLMNLKKKKTVSFYNLKFHEFMETKVIEYYLGEFFEKITIDVENKIKRHFLEIDKFEKIKYEYKNYDFYYHNQKIIVVNRSNGELVGGAVVGTRWVNEKYRKDNVGTHILLSSQEIPNKIFGPTSYSVGGYKSRVKAHKIAIENALKDGKIVPDDVLKEYKYGIHDNKIKDLEYYIDYYNRNGFGIEKCTI